MKNLLALFIFLLPFFGFAQTTHTVAAKESLFSIGRLYNIHPKELAAYNNIPFELGLTIGQVLKIPAKGNTPVPATPGPAKTEPVKQPASKANTTTYHTVAKKEGLYSISKKYNASIADIKKWNNLTSDALNEGMNLIVGYSGSGQPQAPAVASPVANKKVEASKEPETKVIPVEPSKPAKTDVSVNRGVANFRG